MPPFGASSTSCRDRTADFNSLVDRLRREQGGASSSGAAGPSGATPPQATSSAGQQSEFARRAARIGQGMHSTSQKLFKLSQLAKAPPGPFDDGAQEINSLSAVVKQEIQAMNVAIADLQNVSAASREGNRQSVNHSHTVVDSLRNRLKDTTKQFKDVLTVRQENLKAHQGRRQLFSAVGERPSGSGQSALLPRANSRPLFGGSGLQGTEQGSRAGPSEMQPLLPQTQQQQQLLAPQDTYLSSRAEALQNVESTILELGGIFQQLAQMVQEQGEMVVRIDENVDDTLANVDSAQAQLLKYLNSISSNRWLVMKVFFVLMVFMAFFLVFVA